MALGDKMTVNCEDCRREIYYDDVHGYWAHVPINGSIPRHIPRVPKWAEKNELKDDTSPVQYDIVQDGYVIYYKGKRVAAYLIADLLNKINTGFDEMLDDELNQGRSKTNE